jgi:hypothetical protein
MFEVMQNAGAFFVLSPDTSFCSSFVNCNDTLMILAENLEEKLSECSVLNESVVASTAADPVPIEPAFIP